MLTRLFAALAVALALAGCAGPAEPTWAPDHVVARHRYVPDTPPRLTLFTMVSTTSGAGAHSGLMITTPEERIIFDPAGTFRLNIAPERNDVHHGVSDRVLAVYRDYHARETFSIYEYELDVPVETARYAAELVKSNGAVPKAQCSLSISRVLGRLPGFEGFPSSYFPKKTMNAFASIPGVRFRLITDDDADDNHGVLIAAARDLRDR